MIFLANCPDTTGLVAKISTFFASNNLNILKLEEHTERGQFFIRIQSTDPQSTANFSKKFQKISKEIDMQFSLFSETKKTKVVLFCSATLPTPLEIILGEISDSLPIKIVHIVSNHETIRPIAEKFMIPFSYVPSEKNNLHEQEHIKILENIEYDVICLARYMKIISDDFLQQISNPIINIHHSFLPSFIGGKPYEMAFERGVKLIGATSHFVTKDLDEGPIIAQDVFHIGHSLSLEEMKKEGANIEKKVFSEALKKFAQHKLIEWKGRVIVFQ